MVGTVGTVPTRTDRLSVTCVKIKRIQIGFLQDTGTFKISLNTFLQVSNILFFSYTVIYLNLMPRRWRRSFGSILKTLPGWWTVWAVISANSGASCRSVTIVSILAIIFHMGTIPVRLKVNQGCGSGKFLAGSGSVFYKAEFEIHLVILKGTVSPDFLYLFFSPNSSSWSH